MKNFKINKPPNGSSKQSKYLKMMGLIGLYGEGVNNIRKKCGLDPIDLK